MVSTSNEANVICALQALQRDPELAVRDASRIYGVPRTTLRRRRSEVPCRADTTPGSRKLTDPEEKLIIERILDLDSRAQPPRLRDVEAMANRLLELRHDIPVGRNWVSSFIRRHPELATRLSRGIDYQRVQCEDADKYRAWFELVRDTMAKYGIRDGDAYNFDETGFAMGLISAELVVTSSERRQRARKTQQGSRQWATLIECISANGHCVPPFVILSGKVHLSSWYENSPLPHDWAIAVTENGWTTNERCLDWLQHFDKHTKGRTAGRYRLLILDGHDSHRSAGFEGYCKENNIVTICMPAHSSHRLQPLDVACFRPLKRAYSRAIEELMRARVTHITKEEFLPAVYAAHKAAMTESNIRGGFRGAGIIPFDPEHVISQLDVRLQTPPPPGASDGADLPWLPKTPSNPAEALCHTEYIAKRIREHRSSSPAEILESLNQMTKSATKFMRQMALLEDENRNLREANERLSTRRRGKKRRLQAGGCLTLEAGSTLASKSGEKGPSRRDDDENVGRRKGAETRRRHCRSFGHNFEPVKMSDHLTTG